MRKAVWHTDHKWLYIHFEKVGDYKKFTQLIAEFKALKSSAWKWDASEKTWKVPIRDSQKVFNFVSTYIRRQQPCIS